MRLRRERGLGFGFERRLISAKVRLGTAIAIACFFEMRAGGGGDASCWDSVGGESDDDEEVDGGGASCD